MNAPQSIPGHRQTRYVKVVVRFERRADGGLRAWSETVPELVLSHRDADALLADIRPALDVILSERFGSRVVTEPLDDLHADLESRRTLDPVAPKLPQTKEYVALYA